MKYTYPKISNCLTYKRCDIDSVTVTDHITDEVYIMDLEEARYIKKLDGLTHPYDIETNLSEEEIDNLIDEMDNCCLLKESNTITSGGTSLRTIWEPKQTILFRLIAFLFNNLLLTSWLPVLVIGIFLFNRNLMFVEFDMAWIGYIIGLVPGIILHEFGHAFAGTAYGARVFEMGIMRMYYILPGAYVILDKKSVKNRLKRVQINAAGVEMNLLLSGLFLIMGALNGNLGGMFLIAAIQNAFLAVMNLTFIKGLDGMAILSELLGAEEIAENALKIIFSRKKKKELRAHGIAGKATVLTCYMISALQFGLPVLIVLNIMEVILCFV